MPYSERFSHFLPFIFSHECVFLKGHYGDYNHVIYEYDPSDNGGYTKWGVDLASHKSLGVEGIKNLTQAQATEIYWQEWQKNDCEHYPFPLGEVFFNACVNCGTGRALKLLAKSHEAAGFIGQQEDFYKRLAAAVPKDAKFLKGWLNRCEDLRRFLNLTCP